MANYDNSRYTYAQVLAGIGYYKKDDMLRYSAGVKTMQEKLNKAGHNCGTPDGKFGTNTHNAVYAFQVAQDLKPDCLAGKDTLKKLDSVTSGGSTTGDAATMRNNIVTEAAYWIGKIPYCIDSVVTTQVLDKNNPPAYMDCSDFSSSVYLTILGINIGANTAAQIKRGVSVSANAMQPGDLILFDWDGDGKPNHVGICSATGEMIDEHGSNSDPNNFKDGQNVRRQTLTDYFKSHILDVRRIIQDDGSLIN